MKNNIKPNYQGTVRELLYTAKSRIGDLGKKIVKDYNENNIDEALLEEWLHLKNAINMHQACNAYYRGSAFYRADAFHSANISQPRNNENESLTTIDALQPIEYYGKPQNATTYELFHVAYSYTIKDNNDNPSKTLLDLLFSRTSLDCSAAIQIANYLTLLDLFKLILGAEQGTQLFDVVFSSKSEDRHNLNRLRIGTMGSAWTGDWFDFSPLYSFIKPSGQHVSIDDLQKSPDRYVGSRFYIKGHRNYLDKHPAEAAQGWNVVFLGLNEMGNPLFLAACEVGQRFIYTYKEMLTLLAAGFNKFSTDHENNLASTFCQEQDIVGLINKSQLVFDTAMIKLLLLTPEKAMKQLSEFCQQAYVHLIIRQNYDTKSTLREPVTIHYPIINITKDDHDKILLDASKSTFRPDPVKLVIKDDLDLRFVPRDNSLKFFKSTSHREVINLVTEARELVHTLYSGSIEEEGALDFYRESMETLDYVQNTLQQNKLKQTEIDRLAKFTQQLRVWSSSQSASLGIELKS